MPTPNMLLDYPTLGGDSGVWDDKLNAASLLIDAHDHTTNKGVRVPVSGLNINADVPMGGFGVANAKYLQLFNQAASPAVSRSFWVKTSDGELYWRTAGGTDIKITSGTGLNLSLVGGITGDYASVSASFYYDDANKTYRALRQAPLPNFWASVSMGDLDLYEKASGITNRVRLKSPAALAASYDLTFAAALPGSTQLMQVSSAGAITFSNTVANAVTLSSTLSVAGAVTLSGEIKHGDRVLVIPGNDLAVGSSNWTATGDGYALSSGAGNIIIPIPHRVGDRIKSVVVRYGGDGVADFTDLEIRLAAGDGTSSTIGTSGAITNPGAATDTTIDVTDTTPSANQSLFFRGLGNATNLRIYHLKVTYDHP